MTFVRKLFPFHLHTQVNHLLLQQSMLPKRRSLCSIHILSQMHQQKPWNLFYSNVINFLYPLYKSFMSSKTWPDLLTIQQALGFPITFCHYCEPVLKLEIRMQADAKFQIMSMENIASKKPRDIFLWHQRKCSEGNAFHTHLNFFLLQLFCLHQACFPEVWVAFMRYTRDGMAKVTWVLRWKFLHAYETFGGMDWGKKFNTV